MRAPLIITSLLAIAVSGSPAAPQATGGSSLLEKRIAALVPTEAEDRWMTVPWRTNVMTAISESRRTGKPVMLWVMNGNPLGCA